jgi:hypothetical protein
LSDNQEKENYKVVDMTYTESASVMVKADTHDEAEEYVFDTFGQIPDLKIISITDADPDLVADVKADAQNKPEKEVLN